MEKVREIKIKHFIWFLLHFPPVISPVMSLLVVVFLHKIKVSYNVFVILLNGISS